MSNIDDGIDYLLSEWETEFEYTIYPEARAALAGLIYGLVIAAANPKVAEIIAEQDAKTREKLN